MAKRLGRPQHDTRACSGAYMGRSIESLYDLIQKEISDRVICVLCRTLPSMDSFFAEFLIGKWFSAALQKRFLQQR